MSQTTIQRRLTSAFIAQKPVTITFTPHVKADDGTGGYTKTSGATRDPQVVTLVEPSDSGYRTPTAGEQGSETAIDFLLVGQYDMLIAKGDTFTYDGHDFRVVTLMPANGYETRALVSRFD